MYEPRFYRRKMWSRGLTSFQVVVRETDLWVAAKKNLKKEALKAVLHYREELEKFIHGFPLFVESFAPVEVPDSAPPIVRRMAKASEKAGVGPMAAVAGAIAEFVGKDLLQYSPEVVVENGGDIFLKVSKSRKIAIYAGESPLSNKVALKVEPKQTPLGICTSSGTVGHSFSFGMANAVVVLSKDTCLADAAATAIGNIIQTKKDIQKGLKLAQTIEDLSGVVIIKDDQIGAWGNVKLIPL